MGKIDANRESRKEPMPQPLAGLDPAIHVFGRGRARRGPRTKSGGRGHFLRFNLIGSRSNSTFRSRGQEDMAEHGNRYRVGFDIGGTFTDFVLLDEATGELRLHKCLTTRDDPSVGARQGLGELLNSAGLNLTEVGTLVHGT